MPYNECKINQIKVKLNNNNKTKHKHIKEIKEK